MRAWCWVNANQLRRFQAKGGPNPKERLNYQVTEVVTMAEILSLT
jgi:hypothetical protein